MSERLAGAAVEADPEADDRILASVAPPLASTSFKYVVWKVVELDHQIAFIISAIQGKLLYMMPMPMLVNGYNEHLLYCLNFGCLQQLNSL